MKIITISNLINHALQFVVQTSKLYNIDESHAVKHSLEVFRFADCIYKDEIKRNSYLSSQKKIIYLSALVHDMCDKKYMNEAEGIQNIRKHMKNHISDDELDIVSKIIETISYSKVKKNGYPQLGEYQLAYHIVREADLLSAYDIDRSIMFSMLHEKNDFFDGLPASIELFEKRVLTYISDELFITEYSQKKSKELHERSIHDLEQYKEMYKDMYKDFENMN
jgi:hypothetical protein